MQFMVRILAFMAISTPSAWSASPKASSTLRDTDGNQHVAANAFDGLL
jgi:hypothetical protein